MKSGGAHVRERAKFSSAFNHFEKPFVYMTSSFLRLCSWIPPLLALCPDICRTAWNKTEVVLRVFGMNPDNEFVGGRISGS